MTISRAFLSAVLIAAFCVAIPAWGAQEALLIEAAGKGDVNKVKEILTKGSDVNARDKDTGVTPLIAAALYGKKDVVKLLIEQGADLHAQSEWGVSPLMAASLDAKNAELVEYLKKLEMPHWLMQSAAHGELEEVKKLIEEGADVNSSDKETGETPLLTAAANGHEDVVKLLLDKGANVNVKNWKGVTPVVAATMASGHKQILELLISKGADVNAKTASGGTALQYSKHMDDLTATKPKGASKGMTDQPNENEITQLLKKHGAKE